jgi:hypothetical protein
VRLSSNEGFGIQLEVTGYEFPALHDRDDGNWLRVVGRFRMSTNDPSALSAALREMLAKFPSRGSR